MTFSETIRHLKRDFTGLPGARAAVLADFPTQHLCQALRATGRESGLDIAVYRTDHVTPDLEIMNPSSGLDAFSPETVFLIENPRGFWSRFESLAQPAKSSFAVREIGRLTARLDALEAKLPCRFLYANFPEVPDAVFGNGANKTPESFLFQLREFNAGLMRLAAGRPRLFIVDVSALAALHGQTVAFDPRLYAASGIPYRLDFLPMIARAVNDILLAAKGRVRKCLVLDLDNTLWGGVVGDDGAENLVMGDVGIGRVFTELQIWARSLARRGVILAVCSYNDEALALEPFLKRSDMILKREDFAVFIANRRSKADNIREIAATLGFALDSLVFVDDNPFERALVRAMLPEVTVPELPDDPAEYLECLRGLNLFETAVLTTEDKIRAEGYRTEAGRSEARRGFASEEEFLESLGMRSRPHPFEKADLARIVQLIQRSNQFNPRTVRYGEAEVQALMTSPRHRTLSFDLADAYGEYGLIALAVLEERGAALFIDSWIMSCRVLKRTMEAFVLNAMAGIARDGGCKKLAGEYLPTPKNGLVRDLYASLGFKPAGNLWELDLGGLAPRKTFVRGPLAPDGNGGKK